MNEKQFRNVMKKVCNHSVPKYRTVDTRTVAGLKTAERLQASGWQIARSGLFSVQFFKH